MQSYHTTVFRFAYIVWQEYGMESNLISTATALFSSNDSRALSLRYNNHKDNLKLSKSNIGGTSCSNYVQEHVVQD